MIIQIQLYKDRTKPGVLNIIDGQLIRLSVPCLGKADNTMAKARGNPTRDPAKSHGDTPLGNYGLVWVPYSPTGDKDADEERISGYGPLGVFVMVPDFETVRIGLLLHAGDPGKQYGGLRPTYGCVRVGNRSMELIVKLLLGLKPSIKPSQRRWSCVVEEIAA